MTFEWLTSLVKAVSAAAVLTWASIDSALQVLVVAIVADYASGWYAAKRRNELSSAVGWAGLFNKVLTLAVIFVFEFTFTSLHPGFGRTGAEVITWLFVANELLSFVENLKRAGVPLPPLLERLARAIATRATSAAEQVVHSLEEPGEKVDHVRRSDQGSTRQAVPD